MNEKAQDHDDRQIKQVYRWLVAATLLVLVVGTVFYHVVEDFRWVDAYYFCVVTLATVGFGDLHPATDLGKIFTTFYILFGVGIIGVFVSATAKRYGQRAQIRHENAAKLDYKIKEKL